MSDTRPRVTSRPRPAAEQVVSVAPGAGVRCPFCHDAVDLDDERWVVCRRCLARHHTGCWLEAGRCATCAESRVVGVATADRPAFSTTAPQRGAGLALLLLGSLAGLLLGVCAGAVLALLATPRPSEPSLPAPSVVLEPAGVDRSAMAPEYVWERLWFLLNEGRYDDAEAYVRAKSAEYPGSASAFDAELTRWLERH